MSRRFSIKPVRSDAHLAAVAALFDAYAASLDIDLSYQGYGAERAGLPGKYAPPSGALLLALDEDEAPLGCVALRRLSPSACEMKRLYVAPAGRGLGLGRALAEAALEAARAAGYGELRLDTLPSMGAAIALYERMGFERIAPYYEGAPEGTIFLARTLAA
jgi:ribosomal protein S18 acetylase RimI-like enzyme